jgi:hypothetical protein
MDALKAPKHYPNPVTKYSLKEMTIVWHLYGGDDFGASPSRKSSGKTDERGSSETYNLFASKLILLIYFIFINLGYTATVGKNKMSNNYTTSHLKLKWPLTL